MSWFKFRMCLNQISVNKAQNLSKINKLQKSQKKMPLIVLKSMVFIHKYSIQQIQQVEQRANAMSLTFDTYVSKVKIVIWLFVFCILEPKTWSCLWVNLAYIKAWISVPLLTNGWLLLRVNTWYWKYRYVINYSCIYLNVF